MESIRFNDTADYQHITVLGKSGVYTPNNISRSSLPEGFNKYTLLPGEESMFGAVSAHDSTHESAGSFVTRETLDLDKAHERSLGEGDWSFSSEVFEFEPYFGKKLAIDTQIQQAEAKREMMLEESRGGKGRHKAAAREEQEIIM